MSGLKWVSNFFPKSPHVILYGKMKVLYYRYFIEVLLLFNYYAHTLNNFVLDL